MKNSRSPGVRAMKFAKRVVLMHGMQDDWRVRWHISRGWLSGYRAAQRDARRPASEAVKKNGRRKT